jgi:hypothetical protein
MVVIYLMTRLGRACAHRNSSRVIGLDRMRRPVAWWTPFAIAARRVTSGTENTTLATAPNGPIQQLSQTPEL